MHCRRVQGQVAQCLGQVILHPAVQGHNPAMARTILKPGAGKQVVYRVARDPGRALLAQG